MTDMYADKTSFKAIRTAGLGSRCYCSSSNFRNGLSVIVLSAMALMLSSLHSAVQAQILPPDDILKTHISTALKNNPDLTGWQERVEAADAMARQAGAWDDPMLGFSLMNLPVNSFSLNREPMSSAWISVRQMLPLTRKYGLKNEVASNDLEAMRSDQRAMELEVATNITQTWYNWAYLLASRSTLASNIDLLEELVVVARSKYETGRGLQQDIILAGARLTELQDQRIMLEQNILTTGLQFSVLLGQPPDSIQKAPAGLPEDFIFIETEGLKERLLEDNPRWRGMEAELTSTGQRLELARRDWWPDLTLEAAYGFRQSSPDGMAQSDLLTVSAGVTLPLYGKRKQGAAVQEAQALQRATAAGKRALELDLRLKLASLLDEDRRLEMQIQLFEYSAIPQSEAVLAASITSYSVGRADFEALLMAETELYDARLERLARIRERLQVRAELAALVGGEDKGVDK